MCASEDGTRVYPWGTCCVEDPAHSDLSLLRSMLFASSMVAAKRKTLELYESSYAKARRIEESQISAREARALRREMLLGRIVVLGVAATSVSLAAFGAVKVLRPELAARLADAVMAAADSPTEALGSLARTIGSAVGAGHRRIRGLRLPGVGYKAAAAPPLP